MMKGRNVVGSLTGVMKGMNVSGCEEGSEE